MNNLQIEKSKADRCKLDTLYIKYDKKYNIRKDEKFESLVNFSMHKDLPFQRWHYYQEGYSPDLVKEIIRYLNIDTKNAVILDPFAGSGSSLVSAQANGIQAIGIELNPFSYFMAKAKTKKYNSDAIEACKSFRLPKYKVIENVYDKYEFSMIERLYSKENLSKVELIRAAISLVANHEAQVILQASLFSILETCSNYKKGGNGLKKRKKENNLDVYVEYNHKLSQILDDIESKTNYSKIDLYNANVNKLDSLISDNCIDLSIFSPPYANCFDYFEVYKIELWLGGFVDNYKSLRELRKSALRSNLNANLNESVSIENIDSTLFKIVYNKIKEEKLWDKRIPKMLLLYFSDMQETIKTLYKKQKEKSFVAIVIGNSAYTGIPVATDLILSEIASRNGFKVKEIIVARNNETASQQYKKIGKLVKYIRESIIILEK